MAKANVDISILFADIAGSSKLYESIGNDQAQRLIVEMLNILSDISYQHNGETLRTIGDEVMCAFERADDAIVASVEMHQAMQSFRSGDNSSSDLAGLYIRIDTGRCIRDGREVFGDPVNSAAKIKSLAKPNQTLLSERTRNQLSVDYKSATRLIGNLPIKGKAGTYDIFEHVWEDDEITVISMPKHNLAPSTITLDIVCGTTHIIVDEKHPILSIGRLSKNDLVLNYPHVSRIHAKIEHRQGRFILVDASINGTYVEFDRGKIYIKHDELQLDGKGIICPGKETSCHFPGTIHYTVRS